MASSSSFRPAQPRAHDESEGVTTEVGLRKRRERAMADMLPGRRYVVHEGLHREKRLQSHGVNHAFRRNDTVLCSRRIPRIRMRLAGEQEAYWDVRTSDDL